MFNKDTEKPKNKKNKEKKSVINVDLQAKLEVLEREVADNLAGWQRCQADYQNLIKEHQLKMVGYKDSIITDFIRELLPIVDHYQMALEYIPAELQQEAWFTGIVNIKNRFDEILKKSGVEVILAVGEEFDPNIHEAVSMEKSDEIATGKIIKELTRGYRINGRVIQQAKVIVAE